MLGVDLEGAAGSRSLTRKQLVGIAYGQGTALARLLYKIAESGAEPPLQFLQRIMGRLAAIPDAVGEGYSLKVMNFDMILPVDEGLPAECGKLLEPRANGN